MSYYGPQRAEQFDLGQYLDADVSHRGGTVTWDVTEIFSDDESGDYVVSVNGPRPLMRAYQNYLGGGMAGRISITSNFNPEDLEGDYYTAYQTLSDRMKRYFHELNNGGGDDYMQENYSDFDFNQKLPESGY